MKKIPLIKLTIGIPGSGKSTWATDFVKYHNDHVRVSRDDYRMMLSTSQFLDPKGEMLVTTLVNNAIKTAALSGYNVIVDQTNVNLKYLKEMVEFCTKYGDVEFKIFDIDLKVAIERDSKRVATVGEDVIKKMYKNYLNLFDSGFDFSKRKKNTEIETNIEFNLTSEKPKAVIFDIDGTLAHSNGKRGIFDYANVMRDDVDQKVRESLLSYKNNGYSIILLTGREEYCQEETLMWLEHHKIPVDKIFMRNTGDHRKDTVIKSECYRSQIEPYYNVLAVYEDREKVVKMWRELGVKCYQVIDGEY